MSKGSKKHNKKDTWTELSDQLHQADERHSKIMEARHLKDELIEKIEALGLDEQITEKVTNNIKKAPETPDADKIKDLKHSLIIVGVIEKYLSSPTARDEVLKGGHVMIEDDGSLYKEFEQQGLLKHRLSSHHKQHIKPGKDASFQGGEIFKEFLTGSIEKDSKTYTWFQLERNSTGTGLMNLILHLLDFIAYKLTGKNVGQYGLSEHLDNKPINVKAADIPLKTKPAHTRSSSAPDASLTHHKKDQTKQGKKHHQHKSLVDSLPEDIKDTHKEIQHLTGKHGHHAHHKHHHSPKQQTEQRNVD